MAAGLGLVMAAQRWAGWKLALPTAGAALAAGLFVIFLVPQVHGVVRTLAHVRLTFASPARSGGATIDCTGTTQTTEVLVTAESGKAFRKGSAIADGIINVCTVDFSFCANQQVEPTIEIHK
jgi:hypothetical protein